MNAIIARYLKNVAAEKIKLLLVTSSAQLSSYSRQSLILRISDWQQGQILRQGGVKVLRTHEFFIIMNMDSWAIKSEASHTLFNVCTLYVNPFIMLYFQFSMHVGIELPFMSI